MRAFDIVALDWFTWFIGILNGVIIDFSTFCDMSTRTFVKATTFFQKQCKLDCRISVHIFLLGNELVTTFCAKVEQTRETREASKFFDEGHDAKPMDTSTYDVISELYTFYCINSATFIQFLYTVDLSNNIFIFVIFNNKSFCSISSIRGCPMGSWWWWMV